MFEAWPPQKFVTELYTALGDVRARLNLLPNLVDQLATVKAEEDRKGIRDSIQIILHQCDLIINRSTDAVPQASILSIM